MSDLSQRLAVATAVMQEAGKLARDYFERRGELEIEQKGRQDLVSIADRDVEKLIRRRLGEAFPDDAFLGEEGGGSGSESRLWVIDPIDGTSNFLRGIPYWCCVLAYVVDGVTELGLTVDPNHDHIYLARRGHGATRNGTPIRISGCSDPNRACVAFAFNFKQPAKTYFEALGRLTDAGFDHRRLGSSALQLCHVADGRVDATATYACNSWDVVAGLLTAAEAGALATRFTDGCSLVESRSIAACTPGLAEIFEQTTGLALPR